MRYFIFLIGALNIFLWACDQPAIEFIRVDGIENKQIEQLGWQTFSSTEQVISTSKILSAVTGRKTGFVIKTLRSNNNSIAEVRGSLPNVYLYIKKPGAFSINLTLAKNGYHDVVFNNKKIHIYPKASRITRIQILRFPPYDGSVHWDTALFGSTNERRPDLIYKVLNDKNVVAFELRDSDRQQNASSADLPISHRYRTPFAISSVAQNTFKLYDYDSFSNEYMGAVKFAPYDIGYDSSGVFTSSNGKIQIRVYFRYDFS